ncbi:MAG: methyltransferase domain-containing protein [Bacteroidota bacterium]
MDHNLSAEYWNKRYLNNEFGWDLGRISTPLEVYFDQLQNKGAVILIPGAGNAYEAEYLFNRGFKHVYICDIAPEPLQNFKRRCPSFDPAHLLLEDFFKLKDLSFDLIVEQTFFCALNPVLRAAYFEKVAELLKPGGKLVGVLFDDTLNSDQPPFGGNKQEYLSYIKSPLQIKTLEACYNSIKPRQGRELFINLVKINH